MRDLAIRPVEIEDAVEVARLCGELGYSSTSNQTAVRIQAVARTEGASFVADAGGRLDGFVHVEVRSLLEIDRFAEVSSLVVDSRSRGCGIGAQLLACAEQWARDRGLRQMRVRSNVLREKAHHFYEREGYVVEKTSFVLTKVLRPADTAHR